MINIKRKLRKVLIGGLWHVAYKNRDTSQAFKVAKNPHNEFCADPFVIEEGGETYIFCEQFRTKDRKGCIGYFKFEGGEPINKGIIIDRPYHMSYPCVFKYHGEYYMIPETGENKTVELFKAERFPDKWKQVSVLLEGEGYVDTTILIYEDNLSFVTYFVRGTKYILQHYFLSDDLKTATLHSEKVFDENTGRGAGGFYKKEGVLYRPSQNCRKSYGENIIFNKVELLQNGYEEVPIDTLRLSDVQIPLNHLTALHTFSLSSKYEVVDVFQEKIDPTYTLGNLMAAKKRRKLLQLKNR